jgi:predicted regulator of Ras-like GTPase activity (Roadblock/LC7/MglB family)
MNEILTNINLAGNLKGCFVADNEGAVVAQQMAELPQSGVAEAIAVPIVSLLGTIESKGERPQDLDLDYDQGKAFIKNFDWGVVVMLGGAKTNLPLLNLLLNIALPKLGRRMDTDEFRGKRKRTL